MTDYDISIVVAGRNDDYGMGFFDRMVSSMGYNRQGLMDRGVTAEFIFVDWAFDPDKQLFSELLRDRLPWWQTFIAVHPDWQDHFKENPRLAFLEFFAKNVGVRRASGKFVLATNCDIFLSPDLLDFFGRKEFSDKLLYRALRTDLHIDVGLSYLDEETLQSRSSISRINDVTPPCYTNASGDFIFMGQELWHKVGGFNEQVRYSKVHKDSNICWNAHFIHNIPISLAGTVYHLDHKSSLNLTQGTYGPRNELAPFGPDWDWDTPYDNKGDWGLINEKEAPYPKLDYVRYISAPKLFGEST